MRIMPGRLLKDMGCRNRYTRDTYIGNKRVVEVRNIEDGDDDDERRKESDEEEDDETIGACTQKVVDDIFVLWTR